MNPFKTLGILVITLLVITALTPTPLLSSNDKVLVEVLLNRNISDDDLKLISRLGGEVVYRFDEVRGLVVLISEGLINDLVKTLGNVKSVSKAGIVRPLSESLPPNCSFDGRVLTWNLDMINISTVHEVYGLNGSGVYIAVLDTGLEPHWRNYFNEDSIAKEFATAFLGPKASVNKNAWESDSDGHGMAVTAVILGFKVYNLYVVDGVSPGVKVIPVKVIGNQGWGWTSDLAAGIYYIAKLFESEKLSDGNVLNPPGIVNPVIISLSVGGPPSDLVRKVIDYAIEVGVFIVAAAGNEGTEGMVYPAAYPEVISVGAVGWVGQFSNRAWWRLADVPEDLTYQLYIPNFSSRALEGQELDVLAPGAYIVLPYTLYGTARPPLQAIKAVPSQYYYLSGTSFAAPHVSGVVALALQKDLSDGELDLNQSVIEGLLKDKAFKITWYKATVYDPVVRDRVTYSWDGSALGSGLVLADKVIEGLN